MYVQKHAVDFYSDLFYKYQQLNAAAVLWEKLMAAESGSGAHSTSDTHDPPPGIGEPVAGSRGAAAARAATLAEGIAQDLSQSHPLAKAARESAAKALRAAVAQNKERPLIKQGFARLWALKQQKTPERSTLRLMAALFCRCQSLACLYSFLATAGDAAKQSHSRLLLETEQQLQALVNKV
jgi:hypothetical protein